jgi:hypothetical protein
MAFTRKALKDIGLTDEQLEKVFALHGTSLSDYQLKSEFDAAVTAEVEKQTGELTKRFEGVDLKTLKEQASQAEKLQSELDKAKLDFMIESRLLREKVVNVKAVAALLDMSKIKNENGELKGLDEQITAMKESDPWGFPAASQPGAQGQRQQAPLNQSENDAYLNSKYSKNPYYKAKEG